MVLAGITNGSAKYSKAQNLVCRLANLTSDACDSLSYFGAMETCGVQYITFLHRQHLRKYNQQSIHARIAAGLHLGVNLASAMTFKHLSLQLVADIIQSSDCA
eukprot:11535637-Karenia_brevis.AAC.1